MGIGPETPASDFLAATALIGRGALRELSGRREPKVSTNSLGLWGLCPQERKPDLTSRHWPLSREVWLPTQPEAALSSRPAWGAQVSDAPPLSRGWAEVPATPPAWAALARTGILRCCC